MNSFLENSHNNESIDFKSANITNKISIELINNKKANINNINNFILLAMNSNKILNNLQDNYIYLLNNEKINGCSQKAKENKSGQLNNNKIDKIKNNKKASFDSSKENKNFKNLNFNKEIQTNTQQKALSNDKKNSNIVDSLSEIKKFKTELCHSWELTGTCKYGQNVNKNI
jgi:hypothetical protein